MSAFFCECEHDCFNINQNRKITTGGEGTVVAQISSLSWLVFYIYLDEPGIGLQRDNEKLIHSLEQLRDIGNSVIVVKHDKDA
jgi:excinuclease ABC subunit A